MSSAKRRRISVTGALPGRKPGMRATRARSRSTFWLALLTTSAGISSSISRLQVDSVMGFFLQGKDCGTPCFQSAFHLFEIREGGRQGSAAKHNRSRNSSIEKVCARVNADWLEKKVSICARRRPQFAGACAAPIFVRERLDYMGRPLGVPMHLVALYCQRGEQR